MRNELVAKSNAAVPEENKIEITLQKSKEVSLLRYERQIYNTESGRGPVALLSVAHPVSFSVKSRSEELLGVINKAKADGKEGPSMMDILRPDSLGAIAKASIPSLAAKSQIPSEQIVAVVDDNELRTENSTFWGDLRLAVPLPKLSSEAFGAANGVNPPVPKFDSAPSMATSPVVSRDKLDEPFVLKRGSKRKSEAVENAEEEEEASGEYDISLNDLEENDTGDDGLTKKERKAQRKAEKRAKKEAKAAAKAAQTEESGPEEEEEEPFDYNKAEPVDASSLVEYNRHANVPSPSILNK
ncbi:hypothetical protein M7I_1285 [Glarea lozoyensis 74030]|uniref:Uncharacterized protein n=1 Tax=Glarea lozoyensis (strain ATCC 74030 / MF5533) TaxID=1104152 RepID=H0EFK9_GLAL7|nr:hypothetical protein M7I_1285 [Glarea lozoyensis 74030]